MSDPTCPACGVRAQHFVPPSLGEEGFYICQRKTITAPFFPAAVAGGGGETLNATQIIARAQDAVDIAATEGAFDDDEAASPKRDLTRLLDCLHPAPAAPREDAARLEDRLRWLRNAAFEEGRASVARTPLYPHDRTPGREDHFIARGDFEEQRIRELFRAARAQEGR